MKLNRGDIVEVLSGEYVGRVGSVSKFDPASFMEGNEVVGVLFVDKAIGEILWISVANIKVIQPHEQAILECPRCGAKKQHWNKVEV
jgi:ribosomal protein L24